MTAYFKHIRGSKKGQIEHSPKERIIVGRGRGDLVFHTVEDDVVSRLHAEIFFESGVYCIRDLESTNGTYVNGEKVLTTTVLKNGDEIKFAPGGPKVTFSQTPFAEARPMKPPGVARVGGLERPKRAREKRFGQSSIMFIQDMINQAVGKSTRKTKRVVRVVIALVIIIGAVLIYFIQEQRTLTMEIRDFSKSVKKETDRLNKKYGEGFKQIQKINKRLAQSAPLTHKKFQNIVSEYQKSVVLVAAYLEIENQGGKKEWLPPFLGTGFFVHPSGLIATNKHVAAPELFYKSVICLMKKGAKIRRRQIAVWPHGSLFYNHSGVVNFDTAYSTFDRSLKLVKMAPHEFVNEKIECGSQSFNARIHKTDTNNDVAILKVLRGGPFQAVRPHRRPDLLRPLTPVISLGFPLGTKPFEKRRVLSSPCMGEIRKVEETILNSAPIFPGNSGGPMFIETGEVIGITTRGLKPTLNMAIKIEHAMKLIR